MNAPIWTTPAGSLGTLVESAISTIGITAKNADSFAVISGSLPPGMSISGDKIYGTPTNVSQLTSYEFVIRAKNAYGITDRTFTLQVSGPSAPTWITPAGYLPVGPTSEYYAVDRQYVEFQLEAMYDILPPAQSLRFVIEELEGELPPGLTLSSTGKISGYLTDSLDLDPQAVVNGGYDQSAFSEYPYDYAIIVDNEFVKPAYVNKIYQFYVTVTDGIASARRLFQIKVEDRSFYYNETGHLIAPFWLSPADLGIVRADNNQVIELQTYDPYPLAGEVSFNWDVAVNPDGSLSERPEHFVLDSVTGTLHATLPYQPAYDIVYNFTVQVIKADPGTATNAVRGQQFKLTVRGNANNDLVFSTDAALDYLYIGQQSELSIVATNEGNTQVTYKLTNNTSLPAGLSLSSNGLIVGTPLVSGTFTFSVSASDAHRKSYIVKTFTLEVKRFDQLTYTQIYVTPFLTSENRQKFSDFISDTGIFDPAVMYRANDPAFGVQLQPKVFLEYGLQTVYLNTYADILRKYFYQTLMHFGEVKTARGEDMYRTYTHDVVYVEIADHYINNEGDSLEGAVIFGDITVYPNSFKNLKQQLTSTLVEGKVISIDEYLMPRFMRTVQPSGQQFGFKLCCILCFAQPGQGDNIVRKINSSGFTMSTLNSTVDRLTVKTTLDSTTPEYLVFPNETITSTNPTESLSYILGPETDPLYTEDGEILFSELSSNAKYQTENNNYIQQENGFYIASNDDADFLELE